MGNATTPTHPDCYVPPSVQLRHILTRYRQEGVSFQELSQQVGKRGLGILLMLLSLPSALPIPAPGYSIPFGLCLAILSLQMMLGVTRITFLPQRAARMHLSGTLIQRTLSAGMALFRLIELFVKPRYWFADSRASQLLLALVVMGMALLMMIPIPMTNTLPAIVIFLVGAGVAAKDGAAVLLGVALSVLTLLFYTSLLYLGQAFATDLLN